jgi:branched-chain amino acid transport system permease protein
MPSPPSRAGSTATTPGYIDPGYLGINQSMEVLAMVLLGGQGTLIGPSWARSSSPGCLTPSTFARRSAPSSTGAILIFTILVMPRGIVGTLNAWRAKRGA